MLLAITRISVPTMRREKRKGREKKHRKVSHGLLKPASLHGRVCRTPQVILIEYSCFTSSIASTKAIAFLRSNDCGELNMTLPTKYQPNRPLWAQPSTSRRMQQTMHSLAITNLAQTDEPRVRKQAPGDKNWEILLFHMLFKRRLVI